MRGDDGLGSRSRGPREQISGERADASAAGHQNANNARQTGPGGQPQTQRAWPPYLACPRPGDESNRTPGSPSQGPCAGARFTFDQFERERGSRKIVGTAGPRDPFIMLLWLRVRTISFWAQHFPCYALRLERVLLGVVVARWVPVAVVELALSDERFLDAIDVVEEEVAASTRVPRAELALRVLEQARLKVSV